MAWKRKECLTLFESASTRGDSESTSKSCVTYNIWSFYIADKELVNIIQRTLGAYFEHIGLKRGDKGIYLQLVGEYNCLVLNWRLFIKLQESMSYEEHGRVYTRLCILLRYVRKYYPTMTQIQEDWESDSGVGFDNLPVCFVPGTLFVANWFASDSLVVRKAPQVFKVSSIGISDEGGARSFRVFALIWDTNGTNARPVRISYYFNIKRYRYASPSYSYRSIPSTTSRRVEGLG